MTGITAAAAQSHAGARRQRRGRRERARESKAERTIEQAQTPGRGFALGGRSTRHRWGPAGKQRELATDLGAGACRREAAAAHCSRDLGRILSGAARTCWLTSFHACPAVPRPAQLRVRAKVYLETVFTAHRGLHYYLLALDGISCRTGGDLQHLLFLFFIASR
jgi:hypothetical protein